MDKLYENLVVYIGKGGQRDSALAFSRRTGVPVCENHGKELTLVYDSNGVTLSGYGLTFRGDFEQLLHRLTQGRLAHEMLVHIAKTKKENPTAIDATAGMGEDSLLLAAAGYNVTLFEQNAVVCALLKDTIRRAKKHPVLKDIVSRMNLIEGDSISAMPTLAFSPDLIYLDPMFPQRQKTGLVNKKLQLIQKLEQPCSEQNELLKSALSLKPEKIIIKRPLKGEFLGDIVPDYSVKGKAIRYDCIVTTGKVI